MRLGGSDSGHVLQGIESYMQVINADLTSQVPGQAHAHLIIPHGPQVLACLACTATSQVIAELDDTIEHLKADANVTASKEHGAGTSTTSTSGAGAAEAAKSGGDAGGGSEAAGGGGSGSQGTDRASSSGENPSSRASDLASELGKVLGVYNPLVTNSTAGWLRSKLRSVVHLCDMCNIVGQDITMSTAGQIVVHK